MIGRVRPGNRSDVRSVKNSVPEADIKGDRAVF